METYKIIRFYAPDDERQNMIVKEGLTLAQAQEHCQDPDTSVKGIYFDGYEAE